MLDLEKMTFLTKEQLRTQAPTVFALKPSSDVSEKYTHIPTLKVIDDMEKLGWKVVDATQVKARKLSTKGFQKHLVTFRNPDVVINGDDGDTVFPQILLTNSHDGKNAFTFTAGLFRMICSNGLVVADKEFSALKMRHMGYTFEQLQVKILEMVESLPLTVETLNKMKQIELDKKQKKALAKKALTTRFNKDQIKAFKIDLDKLIDPVRKEDSGDDLWSVFNVIQEKIIDGDFEYKIGTKIRKARQIKNFKQDLKVNKELFEMATELIPN
tara:strand:- start:976 stop:1785 length:810 start_codon:yes stop_codon:yes gene_type:complete